MTNNQAVLDWVADVERHTRPKEVYWCSGSEEEYRHWVREMRERGEFIPLREDKWPGCHLYRSDPTDVARTEKVTYICSEKEKDAGPTNNWLSPKQAHEIVYPRYKGCMKGKTMYVVPYIMGPVGGESSKVGFEITDSLYVALNMRIMTRMGQVALDQLGNSTDFVKGMHALGTLKAEDRAFCHFPERREIWSYGSGYGGNALLGKKCHALRIASAQARDEGWLAEHMLILGLESPEGRITYIAAAFPSACGKTNLAMVIPPDSMPGWKAWTVGDDIAWMRFGEDGRLWAINPEAGFFGVAPGTSMKTNPNALASTRKDSIFTNVALTPDGDVWWEGIGDPPAQAIDWLGNPWTPDSPDKAAHPNARFTAPAVNCPSISPHWEDPKGVPISAILFGGRRSHLAPLVVEAFSWNHGVLMGASTGSETTAAATDKKVGTLRHDPMAMLPFCGYHMGDYFSHWIDMGTRSDKMPKIFTVNWFRLDDRGKFLWPGFGENVRVLKWIVERCGNGAEAVETPIGYLPTPDSINLDGIDFTRQDLEKVLSIEKNLWKEEIEGADKYFSTFGEHFPKELTAEQNSLKKRFGF